MATREEFRSWAERFLDAFGRAWDTEAKTMTLWFVVLERYTVAQLNSARDAMLRKAREFANMEALRVALLSSLRDQEAVKPNNNIVRVDRGECCWCQETGFVRVPHPKSVIDGEWKPYRSASGSYFVRATVACTCHVGRMVWQRMENAVEEGKVGAKKIMRLEDYECYVCPDWRKEVVRRKEEELAESRASAGTIACGGERMRLRIAPPPCPVGEG